jgi:hypothetical protein
MKNKRKVEMNLGKKEENNHKALRQLQRISAFKGV